MPKSDAAEDRTDIDDQSAPLRSHGRQNRARGAQQPDDIGVEYHLGLIGGKRLGHPGRCDASVVDEHVDTARVRKHFTDGSLNRRVVADVELDDGDALLAQRAGPIAVLAIHIAHRGKDDVTSARQGFRGVTAEAARGAGDENGFVLGHDSSPFAVIGFELRPPARTASVCGRENRG
jgi:hypothetical protein